MSAGGRSTNDSSESVSSAAPRRWSTVFHRSKLSPYVFVVAADAEGEVVGTVRGIGLPEDRWGAMYSSSHRSWPLLDGAVARLSNYGWPSLPDGVRVYGHEPMRLLCHLLSVKPPTRRLTAESTIRSDAQLLEDLEKQLNRDPDELLKQARLAMAEDTRGVLAAVRAFFGDDAADLSQGDDRVMPGRAAWGDAGFSRTEQAALERRGISAREADEFRQLLIPADLIGVEIVDVIERCHAYGLDELRRWVQAGADIDGALTLLDSGRSFEDAEAYLRAGCAAVYINWYMDIAFTPEQYAPFSALGIDEVDAPRFAFAGISPEDAVKWRELGASGEMALVVVSAGGSLADAHAVVAAGEHVGHYEFTQRAKIGMRDFSRLMDKFR